MLISLIICTYNRSDILKISLQSYLKLIVPKGIEVELVIVDNNSKDNTNKTIHSFIEKSPRLDCRYIFEPQQGLSYARNTGYQYAKGDYIAYLDDECTLPPQWLEVAIKTINSYSPAFLGGPYYGKYLPGSSSDWFKESFGDSYILQYNLDDGAMPEGRFISGGNMLIRRDVFDEIGLFDTALGMAGDTLNYGEEQDFQKRYILKKPNEVIWYSTDLFVWHFIRDEKMSIKHLFNEAIIRGRSSARTNNQSLILIRLSPLLLIGSVVRAVFSAIYKFFQSIFFNKPYFSLLYQDYKRGVWRDIGGLWEKVLILRDRLTSK